MSSSVGRVTSRPSSRSPRASASRGQPVQQVGRVVGLVLDAAAVARRRRRGSATLRGPRLAGRALGDDHAVLDDRDAVGERLRLVEVVGGQQDRLAELLEPVDDAPGGAAGGGVEAGGGLVEEDELGVADEREREVEPAPLAAGEVFARASAFSSSPTSAIVSRASRGAG